MKTCKTCGVTKPFDMFYKMARMVDGHRNDCKPCCIEAALRRINDNKERHHRYAKEYAKANPDKRMKASNTWIGKNPDKKKAQTALNNAIKSGTITRWPVCAVPECECTKVEGHHVDYSRPLDVVWLCKAHHVEAHALFRKRKYHESNPEVRS